MNRHIVVLAEEKKTIESLLKRAVHDKPDSENLDELLIARTEAELWSQLHDGVSILLLSSTFSETSHTDFLKKVLEKFPAIRVVSLHHRYGDRSALSVGGFAVIDKPVRNPVLWAKMDEAIADIEADWESDDATTLNETDDSHHAEVAFDLDESEEDIEQAEAMSENTERMFHVKQDEENVIEEEDEEEITLPYETTNTHIPVYEETPKKVHSPTNDLLFDEEEDDEDDLFGDDTIPRYQQAPQTPEEDDLVLVDDEPELELEPESEVEREETNDVPLYSYENDSPDVTDDPTSPESEKEEEPMEFSFDDEEEEEPSVASPFLLEEEEEQDKEENERVPSYEFSLDETNDEHESEALDPPAFIEPFLIDDDGEEDVEEEPVEPEPITPEKQEASIPVRPPRPVVRRTSDNLEHKNEILPESEVYDEKSEWTKADEGFTAKNGGFVSLAPPRPNRRKASDTGTGKGTVRTDNGDNGGLFGSVRSLFKK